MVECDYDRLFGVESAQCIALYPASGYHQPQTCPSKSNRLLEDAGRKRLAEKVTPLGKLWAEVFTVILMSQTNLRFRPQRLSAPARLATFGLEAVETMKEL
jgi:hypothetical protein